MVLVKIMEDKVEIGIKVKATGDPGPLHVLLCLEDGEVKEDPLRVLHGTVLVLAWVGVWDQVMVTDPTLLTLVEDIQDTTMATLICLTGEEAFLVLLQVLWTNLCLPHLVYSVIPHNLNNLLDPMSIILNFRQQRFNRQLKISKSKLFNQRRT